MSGITGVIITLNEEKNIAEAIDSLRPLCSEIIVVDSQSTDRTCEIALEKGARIIVQEYLGDGPQKNRAVEIATNDWILSMDADERLLPESVAKLRELPLASTDFDAFALRRRNLIGSRWIRFAGWYPNYVVRLYNAKKAQYESKQEHARITAKNVERLQVDILHYSFKHLGELFSKADRFSTRGAKLLYAEGKRAHVFSPLLHGSAAFVKKLFLQGGILGGVDGFTVSISAFVHSYLKYVKLIELHRDQRVRDAMNLDKIW